MDFHDRRRQLRQLTTQDPIQDKPAQPTGDGSIQVGEGMEEEPISNATYEQDGFANPIKTATIVGEDEKISPDLEVDGKLVSEHRKRLKAMALGKLDTPCP